MPENIRVQADLGEGKAQHKNSGSTSPLGTDSSQDLTEIARKLAAHGGGVASFDLAFDLVLHGIVDEARASSGASGAAIALNREGKMVCRATAGKNAPDLGVSVGAASGLTGNCLKTGAVQHCQDTELDSRVDPETCRRLGVRSMLLIPLADVSETFGVLQLFSSLPNAFTGQDMSTLARLADRVAKNRSTMLLRATTAAKTDGRELPVPEQTRPKNSDREPTTEVDVPGADLSPAKTNELWTAVLFLLVIVAAIALGIVVGWSNGRKTTTTRVPAQSGVAAQDRTQLSKKLSGRDAATDSTRSVDPFSNLHKDGNSVAVPAGGLVVTENGKVVYRSPEGTSIENPKQSSSRLGERELIQRVEPDYPANARAQHVEGTVILDVQIAEDGSVTSTEVLSGDPLLISAAIRAVRQWHYRPDPGGVSRTRVTLLFTLPGN